MKRKTHSPEERQELVARVDRLKESVGINEACKQLGIHSTSYYAWRRGKGKKTELVTIPLEEPDDKLIVLVGKSKEVLSALSHLVHLKG